MAEATDRHPTPVEKCESARPHPDDAPERNEDAPFGLFEVGELDALARIIDKGDRSNDFSREGISGRQHANANLARAECMSLDGIAAKLELALSNRIGNLDLADLGADFGIWRTIEILALATSVLDLHRIRRIGAEARP